MSSYLTASATEGVRLLSRLRGERIIHAKGVAFDAVLDVSADAARLAVPLVARSGPRRALVRLSRGAGLPDLLPDVLGLAIRVPDADGRSGVQDLLLSTASGAPLLRHVPLPRRDVTGSTYSSLSPYQVAGRDLIVAATSEDGGPPVHSLSEVSGRTLLLSTARWNEDWTPFARLTIGETLGPLASHELAFTVTNNAGGFLAAGPFRELRRRAYPASREPEHHQPG